MTVLMFGWEFPPHITGGLGTASFGITKALSKQGCNILFVVPKIFGNENENVARVISAENIGLENEELLKNYTSQFSYIEINSKLIPYQTEQEYYQIVNRTSDFFEKQLEPETKFTFTGGYGSTLYDEVDRYAIVASEIAKKQSFDIIHAHDWLTYKAGIEAKRISGKPLIVHVHATEFDRSGENVNTHVYDIEMQGMSEADCIICVSELTKNTVITRYHQNPDKIKTVYNGIDKMPAYPKSYRLFQEKTVTFLGRITYQKGPEYFIEAAYKVLQHDKNVRFVMAGSGDLLTKMIDRVTQLGISDKFHFTGFLQGEDVNKMLSVSDVYVMPSVSEPFGISSLEALNANVPIIISKQSGVSEVINSAIKVNFWDVDAIADAIYALLHYSALHKTFVKGGIKEIQQISWDDSAVKIKEIYQQLIKENTI